jgi:autotransporter strand-loop-strand O-heptosyltransferase
LPARSAAGSYRSPEYCLSKGFTDTLAARYFTSREAGGMDDNLTGVALAPPGARPADSQGRVPAAAGQDLDRAPQPSASVSAKRTYTAAPEQPTQEGPNGLRFDFNEGCRVFAPESEDGWRVRLTDLDTGNILFETEFKGGQVRSSKRYFVRFRLEAHQRGARVLDHVYEARGREVLIQFPAGTLGDTLAWLPYAARFRELHDCLLTCAMPGHLIPLFRDAYPEIAFLSLDQVRPERYYATYVMVLYFNDVRCEHQRFEYQSVGLQQAGAHLLGVELREMRPRITVPATAPPLPEPYVCIAAHSTMQAKFWNNPTGWRDIVAFLKQSGYRVICIDQKSTHGAGMVWTSIPEGAENQTGDRPLQERAHWLRHAEFFIGLSSGLAWLAWALGKPVVLISGFTHPTNEFQTPYRVINYHTCNSCWNDVRLRFDHTDFLWCPRHKDTPRQFECSRLITANHVKAVIRRIPGFGGHAAIPSPVSQETAAAQSEAARQN